MNNEKMIDRRVSKGYNRQESIKTLDEILAAFSGVNLASALHYNAFISGSEAEKMQMKFYA
jgi:hypothetical protein